MANVITKRIRLSRRGFLGSIGLPPLAAMFNSHGTAYANESAIETRFVLWFNGNGIVEKYWVPAETGAGYTMTPCLAPLAPFRDDFHVITDAGSNFGRGSPFADRVIWDLIAV